MVPGAALRTFTQTGLRPLRGVHFSVQATVVTFLAVALALWLAVLLTLAGDVLRRFLDDEAVLLLVLFLLTAFLLVCLLAFAVFFVVVVLFFFSAFCVTCVVADVVLACLEAWAIGVKGSVVNSKAQSVIEIRFIRATEQSSVKAGPSCLRVIYKTR